MKISKRVREEAARLCAIAASTDIYTSDAAGELGIHQRAVDLAYDAWRASFYASNHSRGDAWCEDWAEAEAMLRTGWTP